MGCVEEGKPTLGYCGFYADRRSVVRNKASGGGNP
jgi:hypothetical protein